jgi:hypothetical protein
VQIVLPLTPVTVNAAERASEAGAVGGTIAPAPQFSVTTTAAGLLSEKSLLTVKTALGVLMIVQLAGTPSRISTLSQAVWIAT